MLTVRPTIMTIVPRVLEVIRARILAQVPRPRCPTLGELYCADLGPQERQEWDSLIAGASHVAQRGAWAYVTAVR